MEDTAQELYKNRKRHTRYHKNKAKISKIYHYLHDSTWNPVKCRLQIDYTGSGDGSQNLKKYPIFNLENSLTSSQYSEISKCQNLNQQAKMLGGRKFKNHVSRKFEPGRTENTQKISYDTEIQKIYSPKAYQKSHTVFRADFLKIYPQAKNGVWLSEKPEFKPFEDGTTHVTKRAQLSLPPWHVNRFGSTWLFSSDKRTSHKSFRNKGYRPRKYALYREEVKIQLVKDRSNRHLNQLECARTLKNDDIANI